MTSSEASDGALAETAAGAVQGGGEQDATKGPSPSDRADEADEGDVEPPEEVQPTTS